MTTDVSLPITSPNLILSPSTLVNTADRKTLAVTPTGFTSSGIAQIDPSVSVVFVLDRTKEEPDVVAIVDLDLVVADDGIAWNACDGFARRNKLPPTAAADNTAATEPEGNFIVRLASRFVCMFVVIEMR